MPLLHRPTFEKGLAEGLHYKDEGFGSTVLLVSALGSRFCDDPRVILEDSNSQHSAGWEWLLLRPRPRVRRRSWSGGKLARRAGCGDAGRTADFKRTSQISFDSPDSPSLRLQFTRSQQSSFPDSSVVLLRLSLLSSSLAALATGEMAENVSMETHGMSRTLFDSPV